MQTMNDTDDNGCYTRIKAKVQLGEGVDRRGEVTVETVRPYNPEEVRNARTLPLPDGGKVEGVDVDDRTFAEFYFEMDRAAHALTQRLGIEDPGE